jgi:hypothetical protein
MDSFREEALRRMAAAQDFETRVQQGETTSTPPLVSGLLKAGAIAGATYAAFRYGGRSETVTRMFGKLSEMAREFMAPIKGAVADLVGVAPSGIKYRNFDLLHDISAVRDVMGSFAAHGGSQAIERQEIALARARIAQRFAGARDVGSLRRANIGDVLSGTIDGLSSKSQEDLNWAVQQGLVSGSTPLTRGGGGLFVGQNGVVDARMLNPRFFFSKVREQARKIKIPFVGFRPADLITSITDRFMSDTARPLAGIVARDTRLSRTIVTPDAFSYVLGGELRSFTPGGFVSLGTGLKLGFSGSMGAAAMQRYGKNLTPEAMDLARSVAQGGRSGFLGFLDRAQEKLGIGPAFRTKDQFFKTAVLDPLARRDRGVLHRADNVTRRDNLGFFEKFSQSIRDQIEADRRGLTLQDVQSEATPHTRPLSFFDKIKAYLGTSRKAYIVNPGTANPSSHLDLVRPGVRDQGHLAGYHATPLGRVGAPARLGSQVSVVSPNQYHAYAGGVGEAIADTANMLTNRLNDLIGWTTGAGFRPSVGYGTAGGLGAAGKNLAKIYGIYAVGSAALGYAEYADYLSEKFTGLSPKKLGIQAYAGLRLGQQATREAFGIAPAARYMEDLMPKSVDSGMSWALRTIAPLAIGAATGGTRGLAAGAAAVAAIGGTDVGQTPGDLYDEYAGEKLVPIRKSRYWMLGRQPFEGGQIDYFAPGWVARQLSDYKYTSTLYGSKSEYYSHVAGVELPVLGSIPLPTPSNAFGLTNLFDGGFFSGGTEYLAQKHTYDRPYPDSPGVDMEEARTLSHYMSSVGPYDPPMGAGARLGAGTVGGLGEAPEDQHTLAGRISSGVDKITELGGIYKFLLWDMPGFGSKAPKIASASEMSSQSRALYDEQLGGMFGASELLRRFITPPDDSINPIPNSMPGWLPGVRSDYKQDRQYHIDFTLGDPYGKLKMGEFRLPGEAYERLHRLHSGSPGVYDAMDRYLILADVAPYSHARKEYQAIVEGWQKSGVLDEYWVKKLNITKEQVKQKLQKFDFTDRRFTGLITDPDPKKTAEKYNFLEKAVGSGWETLTHDLIPAAGKAVPLVGPIVSDKLLAARSPVEEYLHSELYGEEFADWRSPWESFLRPKANELIASNPLTAMVGGMGLGAMGGTPISSLVIGAAGGAYFGARSGIRAVTGENYVPEHRKQQWELEEYFDNIRYLKARGLGSRAEALGDQEMVDYYNREIERTSVGIDYNTGTKEFISASLKGLPRSMKPYLLPFMEMPREAQESILPKLPEHLQSVFATSWAKTGNRPSNYSDYAGSYLTTPDQKVSAYFGANEMPGPDWEGWHPDVPLDAVKIRMVDSGTNSTAADIHKFELFPEHRFRASRFSNIDLPEADGLERPDFSSSDTLDLRRRLEMAGFRNVNISPGVGPSYGTGVSWGIRYDNTSSLRDSIMQVFR